MLVQPLEAMGKFSRHCASCHASEDEKKLMKCARCQMKWYCSRECQKAHWKKGHKLYCVQVRGLFEVVFAFLQLIAFLRLIAGTFAGRFVARAGIPGNRHVSLSPRQARRRRRA